MQIRKVEVPVNPRSDNIHPRKSQHALRKYFLAKHLTGNSVHEDEQPSQSRKRTVSPSPPLNSSQRSEQQRHQEKSTERSEKLRKMTSHRLFEFLETNHPPPIDRLRSMVTRQGLQRLPNLLEKYKQLRFVSSSSHHCMYRVPVY